MSPTAIRNASKKTRMGSIIMESVEHSLRLKDGRVLAYHTFPRAEEENHQEDLHPVLYFHGYPGYGLEAGMVCAHSVAQHGGRIYAIDRPGMGKISSPYGNGDTNTKNENGNKSKNKNINADPNLDTFIDNVWELVEDQGWEEFSVIGVSGGGPFTLALLASYLQTRQSGMDEAYSRARLRNVCLVGGICMSAGNDGMGDDLKSLTSLVEQCQESKWSRFMLATLARFSGPIYNYLIPALPLSWNLYLSSFQLKTMPPADQKFMSDETNMGPFLSLNRYIMAQGGYPGTYDDAMIAMRARHSHEEILEKIYGSTGTNESEIDAERKLPAVGIFQGGMDKNVPPSHARYMHESIFHKRSNFFEFPDLGHISMITQKSYEYAAFATAARKNHAKS